MPRIREYQPAESSAAAVPYRQVQGTDLVPPGASLGDGLARFAEGMIRAQERDEVSDVQTKLAKARAEWTVALQDQEDRAPTGDPKFAENFLNKFNGSIQAIGDNLETKAGREAFKQGSAALGAQFTQAAGLYQVRAAGAKAKQDFLTALDANRNTLLRDPTQFESVLASSQAALTDPNGPYARMPVAERERLARQTNVDLAKSAVQGVIDIDPQEGLKQLEAGRWGKWLDADNTTQLRAHAKQAIRAEEIEGERRERAKEKAESTAREKTKSDFISRLSDDNVGLTSKDIINSNLLAAEKEHYLNVLKTRMNEGTKPIRTDPTTFRDLFTRIGLPDGDPRRIANEDQLNQAFVDQKLSFEDLSRLRKEFVDYRTPDGEKLSKRKSDFLKGVGPSINKSNPMMGRIDPSGQMQEYEFGIFVENEIERMRKENRNPYDLFNPAKPDYLGRPEVLTSYQKTLKQSIDDFSSQLRSAPGIKNPSGGVPDDKVRKPGETPQQYLDRMKKAAN
ncbi:MAG: hypothetical protein KG075_09555 [Alphaproteobacteria bacterium]|nr:hypothetical protein [Alphaproteobacteria bacterium]